MKRLIYYLLFICTSLSINAKNIYELSPATCTAESKSTGPWAFNEGFVISASDPSKTYQTANGGIKYSVGNCGLTGW